MPYMIPRRLVGKRWLKGVPHRRKKYTRKKIPKRLRFKFKTVWERKHVKGDRVGLLSRAFYHEIEEVMLELGYSHRYSVLYANQHGRLAIKLTKIPTPGRSKRHWHYVVARSTMDKFRRDREKGLVADHRGRTGLYLY